jgi:hypothetical protein
VASSIDLWAPLFHFWSIDMLALLLSMSMSFRNILQYFNYYTVYFAGEVMVFLLWCIPTLWFILFQTLGLVNMFPLLGDGSPIL